MSKADARAARKISYSTPVPDVGLGARLPIPAGHTSRPTAPLQLGVCEAMIEGGPIAGYRRLGLVVAIQGRIGFGLFETVA